MRNMKWVMLNSHVWNLIGDLMLGTLTIPYVFFPLIAGSPLGVLTVFFNVSPFVQTYVAVVCLGEVGASIVFMFENRQNHTVKTSLRITSEPWRRAFFAVNVSFPFAASLIAFAGIPDQDLAKIEMLKIVPCPTSEYYSLPVIVLSTDAKIIGGLLAFMLTFYFGQTGFFLIHVLFYLCISTRSYTLSDKTKKLKQKYFVAVCIQMIVPIFIIGIPAGYFTFSIAMDYYNQTVNNFCFLIMGTHGFFATIATILIYENYRKDIWRFMVNRRRKFKVTLILSKSMTEVTYI
uniref:Serpentine Receptor, class H n=2 Tax=Caenorhabditis japonica TaxID=281687 RepID=A0A8R1E3R5_CAEJA